MRRAFRILLWLAIPLLLIYVVGRVLTEGAEPEPQGAMYAGRAANQWVELLRDPQRDEGEILGSITEFLGGGGDRKRARRILVLMGEAAVPALIAGLSDERPSVRDACIWILHDLGPLAAAAAAALEALGRQAPDPAAGVGLNVNEALLGLGPAGWEALGRLIEEGVVPVFFSPQTTLPRSLHEPIANRLRAGETFQGSLAPYAVAPLVGIDAEEAQGLLARHSPQSVRAVDVFHLRAWLTFLPPEEGAFAAPWFAEALSNPDPQVALAAVGALSHIGVPDLGVAARLEPYVDHEDEAIASTAIRALSRTDPHVRSHPGPVWLRAALADLRASVRDAAARVLADVPRFEDSQVLTTQMRFAEGERSWASWLASLRHDPLSWLLRESQAASEDSLEALISALGHAEPEWLGPRLAELAPLLDALQSHEGPELRRAFVHALGRLGGKGLPVVLQLTRFLADANREVREAAAYALARLPREQVAPLLERGFDWRIEGDLAANSEGRSAAAALAALRAAYSPDAESALLRVIEHMAVSGADEAGAWDPLLRILPAFPPLTPPARARLREHLVPAIGMRWRSVRERMLARVELDAEATWDWLMASLDAISSSNERGAYSTHLVEQLSPHVPAWRARAEMRIADEDRTLEDRRWWRGLVVTCLKHRMFETEREAQRAKD